MTHVLVLTAVEVEAHRLAHRLRLAPVAGSSWPRYRSGALEIIGVGLRAHFVTERVADAVATASLIVSAGTCGALDPHLRHGDLVVPETVIGSPDVRHTTDPVPGLARRGSLLTVAAVVPSPADKARLWLETAALAVDMESVAIMEWARARRLRVAVVRAVSDTSEQAVPADVAALVDAGGRVRAGQALRAILARPRAVADALALGRGADAALKTVAAALGTIARHGSDRPGE